MKLKCFDVKSANIRLLSAVGYQIYALPTPFLEVCNRMLFLLNRRYA